MKGMKFEEAIFLGPLTEKNLPKRPLPQLVLMGRSNVGKSSFINHLLQKKDLAKTSKTPGKTKEINLFLMDEKLYFVDMPGYGFAKVSKEEKQKWASIIEEYLETYLPQIYLIHLLDVRHLPSEEDHTFWEYIQGYEKKLLCIFTKVDKLSKNEREKKIAAMAQQIPKDADFLPYSIMDAKYRLELIRKLKVWVI